MLETPQIMETAGQLTAIIPLTIPREEMPRVIGTVIRELLSEVAAQGVAVAGPWFTHHHRRPTEIFDFEVSVPVAARVTAAGRMQPSERPPMKVVRTVYHGSYEGLAAAWGEFVSWIRANGHRPADDVWEFYTIGPHSSPNPADWRTELIRQLIRD